MISPNKNFKIIGPVCVLFSCAALIAPPTLHAEDVMEEITVTGSQPNDMDHTYDAYWFATSKIRTQGTWDDDIDILDYYEDMASDAYECEVEADLQVSQCKTVYSNGTTAFCVAAAPTALAFIARFVPAGAAAAQAVGLGGLVSMLSCTGAITTAHQWCETTFKSRMMQNCMDADGS
jgi:hypothetical protein